jgi:membrane-bound lytic murein transglycosylase B
MTTLLRAALALCVLLATEAGARDAVRAPATAAKPDTAANASFRSFIDALRPDAEARGVSAATFDAAFRGVSSPDPGILARTTAQGGRFTLRLKHPRPGRYQAIFIPTGERAERSTSNTGVIR